MRQKNYDKTPYVLSTKFPPVKFFFTQLLVVIDETFRMSACDPMIVYYVKIKSTLFCSKSKFIVRAVKPKISWEEWDY